MFALCLVNRSWSSCSITWLFFEEPLMSPALLPLEPVLTVGTILMVVGCTAAWAGLLGIATLFAFLAFFKTF